MQLFLHRQKGTGTIGFLLFITVALFLLSSCATTARFAPSTVVPAAEGRVKMKKDNNNNYAIDVEVKNLAEPNRLPQPGSVYVVWADSETGNSQNLGQLRTSSGLLGSGLKASLETVTPYKPRRIFITAETTASVQYPSNYVVLNTTSF